MSCEVLALLLNWLLQSVVEVLLPIVALLATDSQMSSTLCKEQNHCLGLKLPAALSCNSWKRVRCHKNHTLNTYCASLNARLKQNKCHFLFSRALNVVRYFLPPRRLKGLNVLITRLLNSVITTLFLPVLRRIASNSTVD